MATYAGDFNLDGSVDGTDLDIWYVNHLSGGSTWQTGDANYDGSVDGTDLDSWYANHLSGAITMPSGVKAT